jgi:hypothetical protein
MKKAQQRKLLNVEIIYDHVDDLQQLEDSPQFNDLILKDAFDIVEKAAKTKKKSVPLVAIPNLGLEVSIERHNFKPILQKALDYYTEQEQYERCMDVAQLIESL